MAQRVQIILEDDYDGGTADETVSFALDGAEYEIDLSAKNAAGLRDALAPWLASRTQDRWTQKAGQPSRPVRPAPATSGPGRRQMATTSAVAAGSPPMSGRRTRRLTPDTRLRTSRS